MKKNNIEINGEYQALEAFSYAQSNEFYPQYMALTPQGTRNPATEYIYIDITSDYSVYNYDNKYRQDTAKIMNLVATGHRIILVTPEGAEYKIGVPSTQFQDTQILKQAQYILNTYTSIRNNFLFEYITDVFQTKEAAAKVLNSNAFNKEVQESNRFIVLNNLMRDTLLDIEQDRALAQHTTQQILNSQAVPQTITDIPVEQWEFLPNQDVTPHYTERINYNLAFSMDQLGTKKQVIGFYVSPTDNVLEVAPADRLEAQAVNAWYYSQPEFRQPTRDDLEEEYEQLVADFKQLKDTAKVEPLQAIELAKKWVNKYARMLELSDLLGTEPHGNIEDLAKSL